MPGAAARTVVRYHPMAGEFPLRAQTRMPMHTRRLIGLFALVVLFGASMPAAALGLRCDTRLVTAGMLPTQIEHACGAPFWTESYTSLEVLGAGGPIEEQHEVDWEVWYYNFGSSSFMQRLVLRDGRLQSIEPLGYGVDTIGSACIDGIAARGLTTGELVARCGEPSSRRHNAGATVRRLPGVLLANEDRREEWIYDRGADFFTRYLITNGRVAGSERLAR